MPYCTIEEAWGTNLTSNKSDKRFKKITPDNGFTPLEMGYSLESYPETDVYDQEAKSVFTKGKKKKLKEEKHFPEIITGYLNILVQKQDYLNKVKNKKG